MKQLLPLLALLLVGCGNRGEAYNEYIEWCQKSTEEARVVLMMSMWNTSIEIECVVPTSSMEKYKG